MSPVATPEPAPSTPAGPAIPLVEARGVEMVFRGGVRALQSIDLVLGRGEFVSIVGPSGCGKSTLLRLVAGLVEATAGELSLGGMPPRRARRERGDLAFVFQQASLLPWRTVAANVRLPLELQGDVPRVERGDRVRRMIELVGLSEFERAYPHQLSGGMQMRVAIARALVTRPSILLMDEPFGALDDITRQRLNEELLRLWHESPFTALFVTHNVQEASFLSQRILVMSPRPGTIEADIAVPFGYPRTAALRAEPDFARFAGRVGAALHGAATP